MASPGNEEDEIFFNAQINLDATDDHCVDFYFLYFHRKSKCLSVRAFKNDFCQTTLGFFFHKLGDHCLMF